MHTRALLLPLVLSIVTFTAGCGGDDTVVGSRDAPPSDGGGEGDGGSSVTPAPVPDGGDPVALPEAKASPAVVYLGHGVTLDGTPSTGPSALTYAWTLKTAPTGSALTTASISNATTAKPSFVPDRAGPYTLTLTVTSGDATASTDVVATVIDPPIFFFHSEPADGGSTHASLNVVGAGEGTSGTPVGCFATDAGISGGFVDSVARAGADWWEAPAGNASRAVFVFDGDHYGDGGRTTILATTTSAATCTTPPKTLDTLPGEVGIARTFEQPRLSPDGERVVYVRNGTEGARVATVGFDGSSPRVLTPLFAFADGGPALETGVTDIPVARPTWLDATTVAWVQKLDDNKWQIVRASDAANSTPTLIVSCTGTAPRQFELLPNGDVLVSQTTGTGNAAVKNLIVYPVTAGTTECGTARPLTSMTSTVAGSFAYDFSLSPDKTRVAYYAHDDSTEKSEIFLAPVDGSSPPISITPSGGANRGPRWIGGGAFLSWGTTAEAFDAGAGAGLAVVPVVDGGALRAAIITGGENYAGAISNGEFGACSFARAAGSGVSLAGVIGLFGLRLVRRRRRRR